MSTVNNVSSGSSTNTANAVAGLGATSASDLQNEFLTLLVTQMQNQDPLNPMDSSQMTSQLAQISTVSGIQDLNTSIQSLLTQINALQNVDSANLIGRTALVPGSTLVLGSNGASGGYELANAVDGGTITIQDSNGNTVQTIPLPNDSAGVSTFTWDGSTSSGGTAPQGTYTFTINATQGGSAASGVTSLSQGQIIGTDVNSSGATVLDMGALGEQQISSIVQLN